MVQARPRLLILLLGLALALPVSGQRKFYPDDFVWREPRPVSVAGVEKLVIDAMYGFVAPSFQPNRSPPVPAGAVNTLGEVPDSAWSSNRHARLRMSRDELKTAVGNDQRPRPPFELTGAKTDGITPGFRMKAARGYVYFTKGQRQEMRISAVWEGYTECESTTL